MTRKIIISLLVAVFVVAILFYKVDTFMTLDEDEILKETIKAFEKTQFEKEPFLKKEEIQHLTDFLLRHIDEIKHYNRHEDYRKIQLTEGSWTSHYKNCGTCFLMPTFHEAFIKEYIPPALVDSLSHYSDKLRGELIVGLSVCSNDSKENIDSTKGSVSFTLNFDQKHTMNAHYYLTHRITQNIKLKEKKTLHSIYDLGLTKDTLLLNGLRYTITMTPYSGF